MVLSIDEARLLLSQMKGVHKLMAQLMYGGGLRLMEVVRLRVQDVAFGRNSIIIRSSKWGQSLFRGFQTVAQHD